MSVPNLDLNATQGLSHLDLLPLLDVPGPSLGDLAGFVVLGNGRLEDKDNGATKLEATHLLTSAQSMALQNWARGLVGGLSISQIRLTLGRCKLRSAVSSGIGRQAVGTKFAIEVDLDRADISRTDRNVAEEAPTPSAEEDDTLVEGEETRKGTLKIGGHAEELAGKVTSALNNPFRRGVEPMVVARSQVDNSIVESVALATRKSVVPRLLTKRKLGAYLSLGSLGRGDGLILGLEQLVVLLGTREKIRESVRDTVDKSKFLVLLDQFLVALKVSIDRFRLGAFVVQGCTGNTGSWGVLAEERIDCISHTLHLLDIASFYSPKLQYSTIGRRNHGIMVGINGADTGLESAVEESGEVGELVEVLFFDFIETGAGTCQHKTEEKGGGPAWVSLT